MSRANQRRRCLCIHTVSKNCASVIFYITPWNIGRFKKFLAWNIIEKRDVNDYGFAHCCYTTLWNAEVVVWPFTTMSSYWLCMHRISYCFKTVFTAINQSINQAGLLHCTEPYHTYTVNLTNKNKKVTHTYYDIRNTNSATGSSERALAP